MRAVRNQVVLIIAMLLFAAQSYAATGSNSVLIGLSTGALGTGACTLVGDDAWNFDDIQPTGTNPNFAFLNQGTNATPYGSSAVCDTLKTAGVPACPEIESSLGINGTGSISWYAKGFEIGLIISDDSRADFTTSNKFSVTFHAQATSQFWYNPYWTFVQYANILNKSGVYLYDEYKIGTALEKDTICMDVFGVTDTGTCGNHGGETTNDWAVANEWHHFAFIWEGDPTPPHTLSIGEYRVFQDGVEVGTQGSIPGQIPNSTGDTRIGDTLNAFSQMFVRLDNLNIFYNKALTDAEVLETNCAVLTTR